MTGIWPPINRHGRRALMECDARTGVQTQGILASTLPTGKSGESNAQIYDQVSNAGDVLGGAAGCADVDVGLFRRRRSDTVIAAATGEQQQADDERQEEDQRTPAPHRGFGVRLGLPGGLRHDLRPQRLRRRNPAVEGARSRRQRFGGHPDRLFLPQARRLQGVADLVRARAAGRPRPRQDLAVLWIVAARTGQPRTGAISFDPDRRFGRHRQRGISLACRSNGKAARHRSGLLSRKRPSRLGETRRAQEVRPFWPDFHHRAVIRMKATSYSAVPKKRLLAKALPEPDLKYLSSLRAAA